MICKVRLKATAVREYVLEADTEEQMDELIDAVIDDDSAGMLWDYKTTEIEEESRESIESVNDPDDDIDKHYNDYFDYLDDDEDEEEEE